LPATGAVGWRVWTIKFVVGRRIIELSGIDNVPLDR
jgi:hypothetical protein